MPFLWKKKKPEIVYSFVESIHVPFINIYLYVEYIVCYSGLFGKPVAIIFYNVAKHIHTYIYIAYRNIVLHIKIEVSIFLPLIHILVIYIFYVFI